MHSTEQNNTFYTGDNLHFLYRMNSESVDLIYLDPPFNSKRTYSAPIGTKAAGASFKDMWSWDDIDEHLLEDLLTQHPSLVGLIRVIEGAHDKPMVAYVLYMAQRIIELHRVLKSTGSLYLHCDPTASHYLKIVLDAIFGPLNFRNEIIWHYQTGGASKKWFSKKHDIILLYTKSENYIFNADAILVSRSTKSLLRAQNPTGARISVDDKTKIAMDVWTDLQALNPMSAERTGYPTQKPLKLLERIIKASSNEGDIVFDPFCGCATTCVSAQQAQRKWIGIDIEAKAAEVLVDRLSGDAGMFEDFVHTTELPQRTDIEIVEPDRPELKQSLFDEQEGRCNACDYEMRIIDFDVDHITPKSKGGLSTKSNLQLLCGNCSCIKGDRPMEYLRTKIAKRDKFLSQQITFGR